MTRHLLIAAVSSLFLPPVALAAQDRHILHLDDTPEHTVFELSTRVRHTTVITLPMRETILDFVVGDAEYWHLTGAANVAFLKPADEGVSTNIALVCESGRIYSFLVTERADKDPHLVVRIGNLAALDRVDHQAAAMDAENGGHKPAFVARDRVRGFEAMADQAQREIAQVRTDAIVEVDAFRADYPTRLRFAYRMDRGAREWPWLIKAMWHDGQFTYVRSDAQETPALYETKDGKPSLIAYDLTHDGLYIVRRLIGEGWFQLGKERLGWRFTPPDSER